MENELIIKYRAVFDAKKDIHQVLRDGIAPCYGNPVGGILVTGLNPSAGNQEHHPEGLPDNFSFSVKGNLYEDYQNNKLKGLWQGLIQNLMKHNHVGHLACLDLFPIRCSDQNEVLKLLRKDPILAYDLLRITGEEIERLHPKAILIANKGSFAYWGGKKPVWLGYQFELIDTFHESRISLYEIVGTREGRILDDKGSNLIGTHVILYGHYRLSKEKRKRDVERISIMLNEIMSGSYAMEEIVIPSTVKNVECPYTENCPSLKRATISSATHFDCNDGAIFEGCPNMEEIIVPEGDALWHTEAGVVYGEYEFGRCLVACPPKKQGIYKVKEGTCRIFEHAFNGCTGLTEIILPESVKRIYHHAFAGCCNLRKMVLPNGLEFLSGRVFDNCPAELFVHKEGCRYIPAKDNQCFALVGFDNGVERIRISPDTQIIAEFVDNTLPEWGPDLGVKEILVPKRWEEYLRQYMYEQHLVLIKTY